MLKFTLSFSVSLLLFINSAFCIQQNDSIKTVLLSLKQQSTEVTGDEWASFITTLNQSSFEAIKLGANDLIIDYIEPIINKHSAQLKQYKIPYADLNYYVGLAYTNIGFYTSAISFCKKSEQLTEVLQPNDTIKRMKRKIILSHLYSSTDQTNKAIAVNDEGLSLAEKMGNEMMKFRFLINGGNALQYKGEYALAISYFTRAYEIVSGVNGNPYFAQVVRTNIGAAYLSGKQYEQAKKPLLEAYWIATNNQTNATGEIYDKLSTIILLNDISKVYTNLNNTDSALYYAQNTVDEIQKLYPDGHTYHGEFFLTLGSVYSKRKAFDKAQNTLYKSIEISDKFLGPNNSFSSAGYAILGDIKLEQQKFSEAHTLYQKALQAVIPTYKGDSLLPTVNDQITNPRDVIEILHKIAVAYRLESESNNSSKLLTLAYNSYSTLFEFIEKFKADLNDVKSRLLFTSNFKLIYNEGLEVAHALYKKSGDESYVIHALNWMEKNKANELYIALNSALLKKNVQDSLFELQSSIKGEISFLESKIKATEDSITLKNFQDKLFSHKNALQAVIKDIELKYPEFYKIKYGSSDFTIASVQKFLSKNSALISYFMGNKQTYFITITKDKFEFGTTGSSDRIKALLTSLNNNMRSAKAYENSYKLYKQLEPTLSLNGAKRLIVIPDESLNYLAFEGLVTNEGESPKYLIEDFTLTYAPSINYLVYARQNSSNQSDYKAVAFAPKFLNNSDELEEITRGNDSLNSLSALPFAEEEARLIASLFESEAQLGDMATESNFRNLSDGINLIHLATHAIVEARNPQYSKLLLASDSANDGLLHTYELYNMSLNADLVSLSACNTGVGKYYQGEGVMSLARGFMYAGVPNVMTSLWSVPDKSTSEIMTSFYKHVKDGLGKAEALRQAKLDYLTKADKNTSAPYYWAGFVYIGTVETDQKSSNLWIGLVMALIVTSIVLFINKKRKANAARRN